MKLYDGIKDVAKIIQQADNIELYQKLLDLCAQALEMQDEISKLKEENAELKKKNNISETIVRHISKRESHEPYITLQDDELQIHYCSRCFEIYGKLIQMGSYDDCPQCLTDRVKKA